MNIYPYKAGSESAKKLSEALGIKRIKANGSKFKGRANKVVVNWGCSELPAEALKCTIINTPESVSKASNKLSFFRAVDGIASVPEWTTDAAKASEWLAGGVTVLSRQKLTGHSGEGIVINDPKGGELAKAPLYVKYVPKKEEYRVHVFRNEVIHVQRKARNKDVEDDKVNWQIRNHANGFIFAHGQEALGNVPADVLEQAKLSVVGCGLDFGAVDVIWNDKQQKAYVLEVNTAPGLTGATLDKYAEAFKELV